MKSFKIDGYVIDFYKFKSVFNEDKRLYNVYLQYNNQESQMDFVVDLDNINPAIKSLFTDRQYNIFVKKLEGEWLKWKDF